MPIIQARGSLSSQGYGQFARQAAGGAFIEDVFSTWLYTGNGTSQTITNGIDLLGKGGLTWIKWRSGGGLFSSDNALFDTARGVNNILYSNSTMEQKNTGTGSNASLSAFNANGFSLGADAMYGRVNYLNGLFASWTFRKQPKFFDVVTYTGNGVAGRTVAHNLGSVPGCIIVKCTSAGDAARSWAVYHRSLAATEYLTLNSTDAAVSGNTTYWNSTAPTSSVFSLGTSGTTNGNGQNYVAYLFAHDAGGFGASGTDNAISCGSYTLPNGTLDVNLGYEPQFLLIKRTDQSGPWYMMDTMRGFSVSDNPVTLKPDSSESEGGIAKYRITNTGFGGVFDSGDSGRTFIYIAIRRGPMRTPTSGTSVFSPLTQTGANVTAGQTLTTGFPVDLEISEGRSVNSGGYVVDRLRGGQNYLTSFNTDAEVNFTGWTPLIGFANNTGITDANYGSTSRSYVAWNFRRAPGFFDVVCYTGTGVARTVNHNLGVVPELMIVKRRNLAQNWFVYAAPLGNTKYLELNKVDANQTSSDIWNSTTPTSSVFSLGTSVNNNSADTYVTYLFASCPGVSKVGTYTGTGSTVQVDCGFTAGARFVLIKRTDATGDWYVWDSARGIIAGNDPYLLLNSSAAEVTSTDWVDTLATGFEVSNAGSNLVNVNGASYIFLSVA
jgi:hypothetical protein